ncbi:conserved hypothetical protein [Theileria orientalis strain Shintoku]|uniref:Uncharacterized protein n=1 Tax=Theileria orientalis strain Shintoku TaxID=869250 RepID=J4C459_THEOR|nr:conserved hypothetical protein [Theileria orientalis strain Shintoku]BAM41616.1 conserved hypothetical protein [Theileria orientalis strain Shintoku]|eukprot:XP_009691917.1 conserved hypothetical protein [Theileria orientalis strain Shintoku]
MLHFIHQATSIISMVLKRQRHIQYTIRTVSNRGLIVKRAENSDSLTFWCTLAGVFNSTCAWPSRTGRCNLSVFKSTFWTICLYYKLGCTLQLIGCSSQGAERIFSVFALKMDKNGKALEIAAMDLFSEVRMNKIWVSLIVVLVFLVVLILGVGIGFALRNRANQQASVELVEVGTPKGPTAGDSQGAGAPKAAVPSTPAVTPAPAAAPAPDTPKVVPAAAPQVPTPPVEPVTPKAPVAAPDAPPGGMAEAARLLPSEDVLKTLTPEQIRQLLPSEPQPTPVASEAVAEPEAPAAPEQPAVPEPPAAPEVKDKEAAKPSVELHPDLKIYTLDNNVAKVNDVTKFELKVCEKKTYYTYTFKPGAECVEVRFHNFRVWIHDGNAHGDNFPKEVFYSSSFHYVTVTMNDTWLFSYDVQRGYPRMSHCLIKGRPSFMKPDKRLFRYEEELPPDPPHANVRSGTEATGLEGVKVTTCKNTRGGEVNNQDDFDVYVEGSRYTWYLGEGVKCLKFEYKGSVGWTHDIKEHCTLYPKRLEFDDKIKSLNVFFNNDWYYVYWYLSGRWKLNFKKVLTRPGSLMLLLKTVFNIDVSVSPSLLLYFSNMGISTIRFLLAFYPSVDASFKAIIEKLYQSDLYSESFSSMTSDPDKLPRVLEFMKGTSLRIDEIKLNSLITNPQLLLHLVEELKTAGFAIHELLKKLLLNPEKLRVLLAKMRELGYLLNETEIASLAKNKDVIAYLKVDPKALAAAA